VGGAVRDGGDQHPQRAPLQLPAGQAWGADFVYDEMLVTGKGEKGEAMADAVAADKILGATAAPSPAKARRARSARPASTTCCSSAPPPATLRVGVQGDRDPGYGSTSKMITESAMCLLQDASATPGGIWTPASAMGQRLIDGCRPMPA
jgi:hypothetical protein